MKNKNMFDKIVSTALLIIAIVGSGYSFYLMTSPISKMQRAIASQHNAK